MSDLIKSTAPPRQIMEQMEAGAFRELCQHLRERSDQVQNIDLMTLGGFCRNCLAKWMVLEARKLSETIRTGSSPRRYFASEEETTEVIKALDIFGYDEAAQEVYGCTYPEWKKRHQTKATDEQLRLYKASLPIHAAHNEDILKPISTDTNPGYNTDVVKQIMFQLQAGAFRSLCQHLRERSDEVQNIDLMGLSGFCRNCLAKWLVIQARRISDQIKTDTVVSSYFSDQQRTVIELLDAYDYDEAARVVYGCRYSEWKSLHQKKATDAQMERFDRSKELHAKHDKELLAPRISSISFREKDDATSDSIKNANCLLRNEPQPSLLSNVCCEDVENVVALNEFTNQDISVHPPAGKIALKVAILTVSDRAAANAYPTGDLSGPSVHTAILSQIEGINSKFGSDKVSLLHVEKDIVPDELDEIKTILLKWSGKTQSKGFYDIIFTTGGTGFATRDVTPEATLTVIERECHGLMPWASLELTKKQPLATLSRASAGICGKTIIINLPGSPTGASEVVRLLFPLLLHAVNDVKAR